MRGKRGSFGVMYREDGTKYTTVGVSLGGRRTTVRISGKYLEKFEQLLHRYKSGADLVRSLLGDSAGAASSRLEMALDAAE